MRLDNNRFYNWDWKQTAALSDCSHCWHDHETDSGARTIRIKNMTYGASVKRIVNWGYPYRGIMLDEDGSTTGMGPKSWLTAWYEHHNHTECQKNITYFGGALCNGDVEVRRIAFTDGEPANVIRGMGLKILRIDDEILGHYPN